MNYASKISRHNIFYSGYFWTYLGNKNVFIKPQPKPICVTHIPNATKNPATNLFTVIASKNPVITTIIQYKRNIAK